MPVSPVTLRASFESYTQEAELAPATVKRWSPVIDRFAEHLGHDARRIARTDIVSWKDALLKEGKASRTVRDVYLASVIGELRLAPGGLAVKTAVGIARARMGVVLARLAMEVRAAIVVAAAVLGTKALLRSPGLDQRSIDRKMFVRQQRLDLRMVQNAVMNFVNTSPFCSRSRFFVKVVGSQTGSSGESPTNQRYKRL